MHEIYKQWDHKQQLWMISDIRRHADGRDHAAVKYTRLNIGNISKPVKNNHRILRILHAEHCRLEKIIAREMQIEDSKNLQIEN